jgi:uncharacterized membrane protein
MQCPKCNAVIGYASERCSFCGYVYNRQIYEKLCFYFGLKEKFKNLDSIKDNFNTELKEISTKIEDYEEFLNNDFENLEDKISDHIKSRPTAPPPIPAQKADIPQQKEKTPEPVKVKPIETTPKQIHKKESTEFEINLGQKWLLIIGIITMVFGIGFFLKYSFDKGWIGPGGRVALAYLWGAGLLISGNQFRKKSFKTFGLYLIGGGIAVLYFSTFAAFQIYHLFNHPIAFSIMIIITALAGFLSILYDNIWLAALGFIGGFLTPIILSTGSDNQIALMTYIAILNLGILGIAFYKKWGMLNSLGFIGTYLLYIIWFSKYYTVSKFWPTVIFLNTFFLIYTIIPFICQFLKVNDKKLRNFIIVNINSALAFGFSFFMIKNRFSVEWVGVITISYSIIFFLMALLLFRKKRHDQPAFIIFLAKAILFLIITVPIIFSKQWITIFWAAQATTLLWTGIKMDRRSLINGAYLLLSFTILKFLFYDYLYSRLILIPDYRKIYHLRVCINFNIHLRTDDKKSLD